MPRTGTRYPPEFRQRVVELARAGRTPASLAREFSIAEKSVRNWLERADGDEGKRDGLTSDERAELTALRRKVKVLEEEREILSKAAAWFAQENAAKSKPRSNS